MYFVAQFKGITLRISAYLEAIGCHIQYQLDIGARVYMHDVVLMGI